MHTNGPIDVPSSRAVGEQETDLGKVGTRRDGPCHFAEPDPVPVSGADVERVVSTSIGRPAGVNLNGPTPPGSVVPEVRDPLAVSAVDPGLDGHGGGLARIIRVP